MRTPTSHEIRDIVCQYYRISRPEFESPRRCEILTECRQMIVFLCCTLTRETYKSIGAAVLRDHSTVIHHRHRIYKRLVARDQKTVELVALLKGRIGEECSKKATAGLADRGANNDRQEKETLVQVLSD